MDLKVGLDMMVMGRILDPAENRTPVEYTVSIHFTEQLKM
jgi:hypothetical protein